MMKISKVAPQILSSIFLHHGRVMLSRRPLAIHTLQATLQNGQVPSASSSVQIKYLFTIISFSVVLN